MVFNLSFIMEKPWIVLIVICEAFDWITYPEDYNSLGVKVYRTINHCFTAKGKYIPIVPEIRLYEPSTGRRS